MSFARGSEDEYDDDFMVDGERLEDDEALKLHILGSQSVYGRQDGIAS